MPSGANDDWEGASSMHKALKVLATSSRPISASRVKTAASTALDNVKVCCVLLLLLSDGRTQQTFALDVGSLFLPLSLSLLRMGRLPHS